MRDPFQTCLPRKMAIRINGRAFHTERIEIGARPARRVRSHVWDAAIALSKISRLREKRHCVSGKCSV